jgi:hypothetical protein
MPPKRWTMPDQQSFLDSCHDAFLKAQTEGRLSSNFYPPLFQEWFKRYPEWELHFSPINGEPQVLTESESLELQAHIKTRKMVRLPYANYFIHRKLKRFIAN